MKTTIRTARTTMTALVALCAGTMGIATAASAQVPLQYHYSFYKESIPVTLDASRIAVFMKADQAVNPAERQAGLANIADRLNKFGIDAQALTAHDVRGWTYAAIPNAARDLNGQQDQAENTVAQIAADGAVDFVSPVFNDDHGPRIVTQNILIGFPPEMSKAHADAIIAQMNAGEILDRDYETQPNMYRVRANSRDGFQVLDLANQIALRPEVTFAEPEMIFSVTPYLIPNDPLFTQLWGIRQNNDVDMDGDEAWDTTIGSPTIKTAVFDTGTQSSHPDLNAQFPGFDATGQGSQGEPVTSCDNHGTQVAGCISARINNSIGVVGIAPGTLSAGVKTLTIPAAAPCGNSGSGGNFVSAISYAQNNGFRVTNASLGFGASGAVDTAYTNARNAGLVHFAASGNESSGTIGYPSSSPSVNSVGAITTSGARASFSNFGTGLDFSAPGNGIVTTDRTGSAGDSGGDTVTTSGTSFASPYAAGVAALVLSKNSFLTAAQVESILQTTATDLGVAGYDTTFGFGLLNARAALQATPSAAPPGAFTTTTPSNGATQLPRNPTLAWNTSNFATNYLVEVDNNSNFSSPEFTTNTTLLSVTLPDGQLNAATTYFWRVTGQNTLGNAVATPNPASFTTYTTGPGAFTLTTPTNGATGVGLQANFQWALATNAESYTIEIDNNSNFSSPEFSQNLVGLNSFVPPTPLVPSTQYFWRVTANNQVAGTLSTPASSSFTTTAAPPGAFNLLTPPDGPNVTTLTPTLDWSDAVAVVSYTVQVDDQQDFSSPAINQTGVLTSSYAIPGGSLINLTRYYWRIFAVNAAGQTISTPTAFSFGVVANTQCQGDANRDNNVNFVDVTSVLASWGGTGPQGDANYDNGVNFVDITAVLANWGRVCN